MSEQQVNLYQPIFREQQKIFSAVAMAKGTGWVVAGLFLFYLVILWQTRSIADQNSELEARRTEAIRRAEQLGNSPERPHDAVLKKEVDRLRREVEGLERWAARLSTADAGNREGFTAHLEALARQMPADLRLTRISVRRGGYELVIRGSSARPERVPRYLQQLAQEPVFAGRGFSVVQITRSTKEPGRYDFAASTYLLPGEEAP